MRLRNILVYPSPLWLLSLSLPPPPIQCHGKPGTDCEVKLLQKSKFLSGQNISKETEDPGSKLFH